MTPLQIAMMLHYYAAAEPYAKGDPEHATSRAVGRQRSQLIDLSLLYPDNANSSGYSVTERGRAYVEALRMVPLPIRTESWTIQWPTQN